MKTLKPEPMTDSIHDMSYMLPTFTLSSKDLPAIRDWKVGKKYKLEVEVEMISVSKNEYNRGKHEARFRIHKVGEEELLSDDEKKGRMGY